MKIYLLLSSENLRTQEEKKYIPIFNVWSSIVILGHAVTTNRDAFVEVSITKAASAPNQETRKLIVLIARENVP